MPLQTEIYMTANTFQRINEIKSSLTHEQKKKLIVGLKKLRNKTSSENIVLSPQEPMWVSEDNNQSDRDVIAKTFNVQGDFDPYVNKNRGIQFSSKENDTIANYTDDVTPTAQDQFMIRYETTDDFGNNTTTVVKKYRQGNQFVFAAFTHHDNSIEKPESEEPKSHPPTNNAIKIPQPQKQPNVNAGKVNKQPQSSIPQIKEGNEDISKDIIVTKTIPFSDEIQGADILSDFLRKLNL